MNYLFGRIDAISPPSIVVALRREFVRDRQAENGRRPQDPAMARISTAFKQKPAELPEGAVPAPQPTRVKRWPVGWTVIGVLLLSALAWTAIFNWIFG